MNIKDIIYVGIFLDDEGRRTAQELAGSNLPEIFEERYCHHLTLAHRPNETTLDKLVGNLGQETTIDVWGIIESSHIGAQALICDVPDGIYCANAHPHVTIACKKGVKPFMSNKILEMDHGTKRHTWLPDGTAPIDGEETDVSGSIWSRAVKVTGRIGLFTNEGIKWQM